MNKELRTILEDATGNSNDLWRETNVAAAILLDGNYEGHKEDIEYLEDVKDCIELEKVLSQGEWYFQETKEWKENFCKKIIIENYTHENSEVREHLGNGQYSTRNVKKEVTIFWEDGKFFNEVKHDDEVVSFEDVTEHYRFEALKASGEYEIAEKIKELNLEDVLSLQEAAEKWGLNDSTLRRAIAGDYKSARFEPHEYKKLGRNYIIKRSAMKRVYGKESKMGGM